MKERRMPINCSKCGKFVGKDGFHDVSYDFYYGGWEIGSPLCNKCLEKGKEE